jgi:hypothetical protein
VKAVDGYWVMLETVAVTSFRMRNRVMGVKVGTKPGIFQDGGEEIYINYF